MRLAVVFILVLGVTGCGSSEADGKADCLEVSGGMTKAILSATNTTPLKLVAASAVKSSEHNKAYYIAIRFTTRGVDDDEGVWASNSLDPGSGVIMSVDAIAKEFTDWPDASTTDAAMSSTDQGAKDALSCLP